MVRIACFATSAANHFGGVQSVARELVQYGAEVCVWTDKIFSSQLERDGVDFRNLFEFGTVDEADHVTLPRIARFISFSVENFEPILRSVRAWKPDVILVEGFTLIGRLVAEEMGCPWILLNGGHIPNGETYRSLIRDQFPEHFGDAFMRAAEILETRFGHRNVSVFSFILDPSPYATVHFEPQQWPDYAGSGHRTVYYWGSAVGSPFNAQRKRLIHPERRSIYLSFGTIVWRNWFEQTRAIVKQIVEQCLAAQSIDVSVGLGGYDLESGLLENWRAQGVKIHKFADQLRELNHADLFITHHGMNSTHEAIRSRTPMISLPFVGDEPSLAAMAQKFGLAEPLVNGPVIRHDIQYDQLLATIKRISDRYDIMQDAFDIAQSWDLSARANRNKIVLDIVNLV